MNLIVRWCLRNKSVVILTTVLLIASGLYATTRLNQELLPDVEFPLVTVATPVIGAGPEVVDEQVTQPLEDAVSSVEGLENLQSTSSQGFSFVTAEFGFGTNTEDAADDIRTALEDVELPEGAGSPEVGRQSASSFPVLSISLAAGERNLMELTTYAQDEVIPLLEDLEGVSDAQLAGGSEQQLRVRLDTQALAERNLPASAVVGAIQASTTSAPVGAVEIDGLSAPVRTQTGVTDVETLRGLPIGAGAAASAPTGGSSGGPPGGGPPEGAAGGAPQGGGGAAAPPGGAPSGAAAGGAPSGTSPEPVLLSDVADVEEVNRNLSGISRTNGEPSLGLNILKSSNANTVEVADRVEDALGEVRGELGRNQVTTVFNSATDVEESVSGLIEKALLGAFFAIVVIFAFLRSLRATLVTAVSLPTSVLAALLFSWGDNLTLNILTLAGLTIAVGRVVDDAIVVLENSYRYLQQGYDPEAAALKGTGEVASAITSSTLSTAAVFLPLGLVGGIVSEFFLPLSLTVTFALLASLLVAVTIIPVLFSVFVKPQEAGGASGSGRNRRSGGSLKLTLVVLAILLAIGLAVLLAAGLVALVVTAFTGALDGLSLGDPVVIAGIVSFVVLAVLALVVLLVRSRRGRARGGEDSQGPAVEREETGRPDEDQNDDGRLVGIYTPALRWSLGHRAVVLLGALVLFAGGIVAAFFLPVSFFPPSEARLVVADAELPDGTALDESSERLRPLEDFLLDDPGVESYQLSVGGSDDFGGGGPGASRSNNVAQAFITVGPDASVDDTVSRIEQRGEELYGQGDFQADVQDQGPPAGGLQVTITGGNSEQLRESAQLIIDELSQNSGLAAVESDITGGSPQVSVNVNPEATAEAGLSAAQVTQSLGTLIGDQSQLTLNDTPVRVGAPESAVDSLDEIRSLPAGAGATVGDVADVEEVDAPASINRSGGDRAVTVTGTITAEDTNAISNQVASTVNGLDLPDGVTASVGGEQEDIAESFRNLFLSIAVALVLVYLILVVFFSSLVVPLVILLAVPLTTIGAFGALLLTNTSLSVPALLGVLLLIGIVVANSILLIDFVINARERHDSVEEAIVEAGRARLRPILMTALVTIFALTPLALGIGGGSTLISSALAIPVIGGLATSTLLTLLVVPVGYAVLYGERRRSKRRSKKKKG